MRTSLPYPIGAGLLSCVLMATPWGEDPAMARAAPLPIAHDRQPLSVVEPRAPDPLALQAIAQQAYLKASNSFTNDAFGFAVAVSGETVAVAAVNEDGDATGGGVHQGGSNTPSAGAVYVFVRTGSTWSQQAYLKASNAGLNDQFGHSVALSGDTLVVGVPLEDSNATGVNGNQSSNAAPQSGAAYVFVRNGTTWSQQAYLKASNAAAFDYFGVSVAVSGDTIVVGAHEEDSNATGVNGDQANNSGFDSGAAYVFVRTGTAWTQLAYLKASNTGVSDRFGTEVAISGDTLVVGATNEDSNATGVNGDQSNNSGGDTGAAYVFVRNGSAWSQQAYLKASNTGFFDLFGRSVSISGDTIVVGAHGEDSNATGVNGDQLNNAATESGAAYVFVRTGTVWSQQAYLKSSNTQLADSFGSTVSISADTIVIGAFLEDSGATGVQGDQTSNAALASGAAYVFRRIGTAWSQQAYLKASNTGAGDWFGRSASVSGDVVASSAINEDGNASSVDGDPFNDDASDSGAAFVFDLANQPGALSYGAGSPGCVGTHTLGVNHAPMLGSPHFVFTCDNAPPSSVGTCLVTDVQDLDGTDTGLGVLLHVDLRAATEIAAFDFPSDALGNGRTVGSGIPTRASLLGKTYYVQALWSWTSCSLPPHDLSTSQGLALTILAP